MVDTLCSAFDHVLSGSAESCLGLIEPEQIKVVVLDLIAQNPFDLTPYADFIQHEKCCDLPVILLSPSTELQHKLQAFEYGCDDVITVADSVEEANVRINKSIFNRIANEQLKSRLNMANETAFTAMSDNSDLGINLNFLVEENRCSNLDELGQLLFVTLERYSLSCSLQMRSVYGTKNMEANGMAKDLESQLLEQLQSAGRYVDFGRRTIINYGQASLLVRNMPTDNPKRYGSVKDNLFALIKGLDARVKALDARNKLLDEKNALRQLSSDVRDVMAQIDRSYQKVMRDIATVVEDMAEAVHRQIPSLALSEVQEGFFEETIVNCVVNTNRIFNEGLKVDEVFHSLCEGMDKALIDLAYIDEQGEEEERAKQEQSPSQNRGLELF
jgi:CheY-like chemotaxis protein